MQFFDDRHGDSYPVSAVKRIAKVKEKYGQDAFRYHTVYLQDGKSVEVNEWEVKEITKPPLAMVPAQPGTFILGGVQADTQSTSDVWQTPVIAWSIGADNDVRPWTADGPDDGLSEPPALLFPNGIVVEQGDRSYRTLGEWVVAERERQKTKDADAAANLALSPPVTPGTPN